MEIELEVKSKCLCCGKVSVIKIIPAKWEGQKDQIIIEQKKWADNYK